MLTEKQIAGKLIGTAKEYYHGKDPLDIDQIEDLKLDLEEELLSFEALKSPDVKELCYTSLYRFHKRSNNFSFVYSRFKPYMEFISTDFAPKDFCKRFKTHLKSVIEKEGRSLINKGANYFLKCFSEYKSELEPLIIKK